MHPEEQNTSEDRYIGVDGCRAGWFTISLSSSSSWTIKVHNDIESLWLNHRQAKLILIDIPIGLIDSGPNGRQCDTLARKLLGLGRASSVFTPPARSILHQPNYEEASFLNKELTGRGISRQSWGISPKIREVDQFLRKNEDARSVIREIHPELLFWALNGRQPMTFRKSKQEGYNERVAVLSELFKDTCHLAKSALDRYPRSAVARDDILDALAAAITGLLCQGEPQSIPESPQFDSRGLPMAMAYHLV